MNEYIRKNDAIDALTVVNIIAAMDSVNDGFIDQCKRAAQRIIAGLPAADVRENKRGEWISGAQDFETSKTHECSICGGFINYSMGGADDYYFCPYCGADMREETEKCIIS